MIGKMMSDKLLDGRTLEFYQWERGDPKEELLPGEDRLTGWRGWSRGASRKRPRRSRAVAACCTCASRG